MIPAGYEKGSVIIISNKGVGEWGESLSGPTLAAAILVRLLHHCHAINTKSGGYRLREHLKTKSNRACQAKKQLLLALLHMISNLHLWYIVIPPLTTGTGFPSGKRCRIEARARAGMDKNMHIATFFICKYNSYHGG
ncbi:MAG: ATP-binding protein [Actinomycetota bacterium]